MANDKKDTTTEGRFYEMKTRENTDTVPVAYSVPSHSLTTSLVEQLRLKQIEKELLLQNNIADLKKELNISLAGLADSELYKEVAFDRLRNISTEKERIKARHEVDQEIIDLEQKLTLAKAKRKLKKAERKLAEEEKLHDDGDDFQ